MRKIEHASRFKRDYRRVSKTPRYANIIEQRLPEIVAALCADQPLPSAYRDHNLIGDWRGFRECHLAPDLLLIYRQSDDGLYVELARLGTHSELFE